MRISNIISFIIVLIIAWAVFSAVLQSNYKECTKYEMKNFRVEGYGGLIGGTREVETTKDKADYPREVCVEGITWYDFIFRRQK